MSSNLVRGLVFALTMAALIHACMAADTTVRPDTANTLLHPSEKKVNSMKIRLTFNGKPISATLEDNATARDFLSLLPLSLTLNDYASTEKIADLPRKLSTRGAPAGIHPDVGDITYYAPWGNLAIFYRDFGYASGLVRLGHIDWDVEALNTGGALQVNIEAANP